MTNRFFFLGLASSIVLGATGFIACSGSTESSGQTADAGSDTGAAPANKDAAPDVIDAATCDLSADFVTKIPDASIADGASTTGICAACVEAKCKTEVDKCNHDCTCQGLADQALTCYAQAGGNLSAAAACIGDFGGASAATQKIGIALVSCVNSSCETECAVKAFLGDGGSDADAN